MNKTFYPGKRGSYHGNRYQLPKRYTKYDWKKNFFEESDMESFNRTKFPGTGGFLLVNISNFSKYI